MADHVLNGKPKMILFYGGKNSYPFSNFSHAPYCAADGRHVNTSEAEYLPIQVHHFGLHEFAEKLEKMHNPGEMKRQMGKYFHLQSFKHGNHPKRWTWEKRRDQVMLQVLQRKFYQNRKARAALLASGNAFLVEASPDAYWGSGVRAEEPHAHLGPEHPTFGVNRLGNLLMRVRRQSRLWEAGQKRPEFDPVCRDCGGRKAPKE